MRVIEIVKAHLVAGGYDGLVQPDAECGCELADLSPCCDNINNCQPGFKRPGPPNDPHGWLMFTTKEAANAEARD
jgi:hypothetical protein